MKKFLALGLALSSMSFLASCGQKYYTITWENDDHTILSKTKVAENSMPEYDKGTPTKPSTDEFEYTFTGWTPEIVKATEDATYVANYTSATRSYEIVFDGNGGYFDGDPSKTKISMTLPYGSPVEFAKEPVKPNTARYSYSFKGWDKEITSVKGPATYKAVYDDEEHPCVTMNYQYNSSGNTVTVDFTGDSKFWIDWGDQPDVDKHNKSHTYTSGNHTIKIYGGLTNFRLATNYGPFSNGNKYITSITMSHSISSLTRYSFWNCGGLTSVHLPNTLKSIDKYAFHGCTNLSSMDIPEGVTSIGEHAFESCLNLTSISLPSTVTELGESLFYMTALSNITVASENPKYNSKGNCNAVIETATNKLVFGCKTTSIPSTVKIIGKEAFYDCEITSFNIPNGVTTIEDKAFYFCDKPTTLSIPASVTSIGSAAFGACHGLTSITVDSGNPNYDDGGSSNIIREIASNTLVAGCSSSTIPSGIVKIGDSAFAYTNISSVTLPSSLKIIGERAFDNCESLTSLSINSDIESLGENAFLGCSGITSITVTGSTKYDSRNNCNAIVETATNTLVAGCKNSTIPSGIVKIGVYAFWGCDGITTFNLPESVKEIGQGAFQGCSDLATITLPGVEKIDVYAFMGTAITTLNLPASLNSIDPTALSTMALETLTVDASNPIYDSRDNCNAVVETATNTIVCGCNKSTFPSSVTGIGYLAFGDCDELETANLSNVTTIGEMAFASCESLSSVTLSNSLTIIGKSAFEGCPLETITIPNSVTSIGERAFSDCTSLNTVDMSTVDHLIQGADYMFTRCPLNEGGIILQHEQEPAYRANQYWAPYAQYFRQPE